MPPTVSGMEPTSALSSRYKFFNCCRFPTPDGIVPDNEFRFRYKLLRYVRDPILLGIVPARALIEKSLQESNETTAQPAHLHEAQTL